MKKTFSIRLGFFLFSLSFLLIGATASNSQAALIGVDLDYPIILSDATGNYNYNSSTHIFSSTADPLHITFDGTSPIPITLIGPSPNYTLSFEVDNSGNFLQGSAGNDLEIYGSFSYNNIPYSGLLIAGDVSDFGYQESTAGFFDFTFNVTGGKLQDFYGGIGGQGGNLIFSGTTTFNNDWTGGHSGANIVHQTGPVPIPGTVWIFGAGLIGLVGIRRKVRG